jgi:hypothetical protein
MIFSLTGCDLVNGKEIPLAPYSRPVAVRGERSCDELALRSTGARWSETRTLTIANGERAALGDPAVMGGPFEPPLSVDAAKGALQVRTLVGPPSSPRPLCVQIRWADGDAKSWASQGDVTIDSEVLALVSWPAYAGAAKRTSEIVVTTVDGISSDLDRLAPELDRAGLSTERVLPTLLRSTRIARSGDAALVLNTASTLQLKVKTSPEPASPAWPFLRALGEASIASVKLDEGEAVAIEAPTGEATYPVLVGTRDDGVVALLEVRFSP